MAHHKGMEYKCGVCGATGCKLWREYNYLGVNLQCAPCAAKSQKRDISSINAEGMRELVEYDWGKGQYSDQIGWMVPAVPEPESGVFGAAHPPR
jgi:hypothetical protein